MQVLPSPWKCVPGTRIHFLLFVLLMTVCNTCLNFQWNQQSAVTITTIMHQEGHINSTNIMNDMIRDLVIEVHSIWKTTKDLIVNSLCRLSRMCWTSKNAPSIFDLYRIRWDTITLSKMQSPNTNHKDDSRFWITPGLTLPAGVLHHNKEWRRIHVWEMT